VLALNDLLLLLEGDEFHAQQVCELLHFRLFVGHFLEEHQLHHQLQLVQSELSLFNSVHFVQLLVQPLLSIRVFVPGFVVFLLKVHDVVEFHELVQLNDVFQLFDRELLEQVDDIAAELVFVSHEESDDVAVLPECTQRLK